ncbi:hypothetical protein COCMIDRAFT_81573, partial [Bipolaris oryzae ATCC 44560]
EVFFGHRHEHCLEILQEGFSSDLVQVISIVSHCNVMASFLTAQTTRHENHEQRVCPLSPLISEECKLVVRPPRLVLSGHGLFFIPVW